MRTVVKALALIATGSVLGGDLTERAAWAQGAAPAVSQFVTLDQERLFQRTLYGRRIIGHLESERLRLAEETLEVERALEAEELNLTRARETLSPEEFRAKANAFDEKVVALRAEAEETQKRFVTLLDQERAQFFEQVAPVLGQLVVDLGAIAILDRSVILLTTRNIDITDLAITRVDAVLGDGLPKSDPAPDGAETPAAPQDGTPAPADAPAQAQDN